MGGGLGVRCSGVSDCPLRCGRVDFGSRGFLPCLLGNGACVFYWENGLVLRKAKLAIDFRRRQARAFISHAHTDHMARHEYALCTPATAALYQLRLGKRPIRELPYRTPTLWGGLRLTTYPAGHCLGSAMLLAEDGQRTLLYTGDFKLADSATAEPAELPHAEILVIESTYGDPACRHPPRAEAIEQLCHLVAQILKRRRVPVVEAYALGKAQEVTRILADAGFTVLQHPAAFQITQVYEAFGVAVGCGGCSAGLPAPGTVWVVPPRAGRHLGNGQVRIAVTGWAVDPRIRSRLGADFAVPLSDHADYDDLVEAVRQVQPRKVYCTHGPVCFVERLRHAGYDAEPLGRFSR